MGGRGASSFEDKEDRQIAQNNETYVFCCYKKIQG